MELCLLAEVRARRKNACKKENLENLSLTNGKIGGIMLMVSES